MVGGRVDGGRVFGFALRGEGKGKRGQKGGAKSKHIASGLFFRFRLPTDTRWGLCLIRRLLLLLLLLLLLFLLLLMIMLLLFLVGPKDARVQTAQARGAKSGIIIVTLAGG